MDHAIDQGFAYGSGWGVNKHYGYQIRDLYKGIWILRDELAKSGKLDEYVKVLMYWSGIQEARLPYAEKRDEILDTWNTLLNSKVLAVMLQKEDSARYAYMKLLSDWVSESMLYSDGTLGGLKPDGTSFHHGGHYPSYSVGAFAAVGNWCHFIKGTEFVPTEEARRCFKNTLMAMRNYSHTRDWGIGVCGRHPLDGAIPENDVLAFARLAMLGDLTGSGKQADPELGGAYIALGGTDKEVLAQLKKMGISSYAPQEGFTVYNYAALGIHRRNGWMLSLKGYNSDVWASEIYAKENRYGRYLSYGTAQVFTKPTAKESGYVREGWDWNRFPGATTIHLPFELLNSPLPGTLMERNDSRFPGVSSLEGMNGCLAFTYVEKNRKNFSAGATATKSVFCFDNRIIHIGTGISNKSQYPTETTLYQFALADKTQEVDINDIYSGAFPYSHTVSDHTQVVLTDNQNNFYIIKDGYGLVVEKKSQVSPSDEMKDEGRGDFISAYINHGTSPVDASYEYMLLVKPSTKEVKSASKKLPYTVVKADNYAHVVKDSPTGITAYIIYKAYESAETLVSKADSETIVMERTREDGSTVMSICTPDLGLSEKTYTTGQISQPIVKKVTLNGTFSLAQPNDNVKLTNESNKTVIEAICQHGQPVEFIIAR
jgi:chondroitin-sulfate-ABC endolyase/exolyase